MKPFKIPPKYMQWEHFKSRLDLMAICPAKKLGIGEVPSMQHLAYDHQVWVQGYPLYCVRDSLLADMLSTDVGDRLELFDDIRLPVPCYAIFLPKGQFQSPSGGAIDYMIVRHEELNSREFKNIISWSGIDDKDQIFLGTKRIRCDGTLQASYFTTDEEEKQKSALSLRNLVLQSVLLLQYYVDEISSEYVPPKPKGFAKPVSEPAFQLPRWLGKESTSGGGAKGTHFRRGHWRLARVGEGRVETRKVWVRPAWVNPTVE